MFKLVLVVFLILTLSVGIFASQLSDNDGSSFISVPEFDSFVSNLDNYLVGQIKDFEKTFDDAVASYIENSKLDELEVENLFNKVKNATHSKQICWYGRNYPTNWRTSESDSKPGYDVTCTINMYGYWGATYTYSSDCYSNAAKTWKGNARKNTGMVWELIKSKDDSKKYLSDLMKGVYVTQTLGADYYGYATFGAYPYQSVLTSLYALNDGMDTSHYPTASVKYIMVPGSNSINEIPQAGTRQQGYVYTKYNEGLVNFYGSDLFFGGDINSSNSKFYAYCPDDTITYQLDSITADFVGNLDYVYISSNSSFNVPFNAYTGKEFTDYYGTQKTPATALSEVNTVALNPPIPKFDNLGIENYMQYALSLAGFDAYLYAGVPIFKSTDKGKVSLNIKNYDTTNTGTLKIKKGTFGNTTSETNLVKFICNGIERDTLVMQPNTSYDITFDCGKDDTFWMKVNPSVDNTKVRCEVTNDKIKIKLDK